MATSDRELRLQRITDVDEFDRLAGEFHGEEVIGATIRTPPLNAILSAMSDERAVDLVVRDLLGDARDLPGVLGDRQVARRFAVRWAERTGRTHRIKTAEPIFQLTRAVAPRPARGRLRRADRADLDVIARWFGGAAGRTPSGIRIGAVYTLPRAMRPRLCEQLRRGRQPGAARRGPSLLLPVHGSGRSHLNRAQSAR